jgi:hypothetical protein
VFDVRCCRLTLARLLLAGFEVCNDRRLGRARIGFHSHGEVSKASEMSGNGRPSTGTVRSANLSLPVDEARDVAQAILKVCDADEHPITLSFGNSN